MRAGPAILLAAASLAAACGNDFAPYNRVTKLRVLAIAADPPAPAHGEISTLTPLIYSVPGDPPTSYAWSWCPAPGPSSAGFPCLVTEADVAAGGQAGTVPSFDLGAGETAMFAHAVDPAILQRLCQGVPGSLDKPDCSEGFPVQIKLAVTSATTTIVAVTTLSLRFDPAMPPNANPRVDGLTADLGGGSQVIGDTPDAVLPRNKETVIHAQVPEEVAETLPGNMRERLILSWFVETGDVKDGRTEFSDGVTTFDDAEKNRWTPATTRDYADDTARLIVVIRDSRGGVGWRSGVVRLEPTP